MKIKLSTLKLNKDLDIKLENQQRSRKHGWNKGDQDNNLEIWH